MKRTNIEEVLSALQVAASVVSKLSRDGLDLTEEQEDDMLYVEEVIKRLGEEYDDSKE